MEYINIPELDTLTSQQVFDISVKHVLKNGKPSMCAKFGGCTYGGIGCAAAPFLKEEYRECTWGSWAGLIGEGKVSPYHNRLIARLQSAHDYAASASANGEPFIGCFKDIIAHIAKEFNLNGEVYES